MAAQIPGPVLAERPGGEAPSSPPYAVLVVEDDPGMREAVAAVLESEYTVLTAATAPQALALLEQHQVAVVLTDQRLPGPTGIEFLATVREAYPEVVRLLTTAYKDLDVAIEAINRGEVYRYLEKPLRDWELRAAVTQAIERYDASRARSQFTLALETAREDLERTVRQRSAALVRALGEAREQAARQAALARLARAMCGSLDPQQVCRSVVESAVQLLAAPLSRLWTLEPPGASFRLAASAGAPELQAFPRAEIAVGEGFVTAVARAQEAVTVAPLAGDPRYGTHAWAAAHGLAGIAGVPVRFGDQLLGVLTVSRLSPGEFQVDEIATLQALADQAALAIANARLFEAVARGKAEWERTFDAATDLIALLDRDGRIIRANRAFGTRVGQRPETWVEQPADLLASSGLLPGQGLVARVLGTGEPAEAEVELPVLGGAFHLSASPVPGEAGSLQGVVLVLRDITEQRRLQAAEEGRRRAEELSRHKSAFLAHLSHELRSPLHSILGFTEILQARTAGGLGTEEASFLDDIRESAEHLLALINDLLDLAKAEAGRLALAPQRCAVPALLEAAINPLAPQARAKDLTVTREVAEGVDEVWGDPLRIYQILVNLLSNAVKFTPAGGAVHVSAHARADQVELRVQDTGIGVAAEDQARIFQAFEQVRGPEMPPQEGTGLGLALTKQLVELHGGRIWVESAGRGHGATFSFTLPAHLPTLGRRVFVVEDEDAIRRGIRDGLVAEGYAVDEAARGDEALAAVLARPPDLVLLDVGLPGLDGREVLARLRAHPAMGRIPVVILTGLSDARAEELLALGADEFLTKPFSLTVLRQVVGLLLARRRARTGEKPGEQNHG